MFSLVTIPFYWVLIILISGWIGGTCLGLILGVKLENCDDMESKGGKEEK